MATPKLEEQFTVSEENRRRTEALKKRQAELFKQNKINSSKLSMIEVELKRLEKQFGEQTKQIDEAMKDLRKHQARSQKREELKDKILELMYEDLSHR